MEKMYGLDIFTGKGSNTKALEKWVTPIAYCERERYAQAQLLSRMSEGELPVAPIWDDITTLAGWQLPTLPNIIYGGFPCQDISVAGTGKGLGGDRSGLFFEISRLAQEIRPEFIFLENVPAIRTRGQREVASELARIGYDCRWTVVSAREVGAPHLRKRWFCLAHSNSKGLSGEADASKEKDNQRVWENHGRTETSPLKCGWWSSEPEVGRVVDGCAFRVDQIKQLGNGVVPIQARTAFEILSGTHEAFTS